MDVEGINLFGTHITLSPEKASTNAIRSTFEHMAFEQHKKTSTTFNSLFTNLDDLYARADDLANEVRTKAIDQAMRFLAAQEIYEITEQQFFTRFMDHYDTWDVDFEPIADQYEAIVERTDELDAHRTSRRKNRSQWVGLNEKGVHAADSKNLISNVGHGVFNMMAKGVTAIGNALKKDELFKSTATRTQVSDGLANIATAAYYGTLDAINALKPGVVHIYSDDDISRAAAIIENVQKNRVPQENIRASLLKAISLYPYNRDTYVLLLTHFGGDQTRLDQAVAYFGVPDLASEKKRAFDTQRNATDMSTLTALNANLPALQQYAHDIGYTAFAAEAKALHQTLAQKAFDARITAFNLNTVAELRTHTAALHDYAKEIDYRGYEADLTKVLAAITPNDFQREAAKYALTTPAECEQHLPTLEAYANDIGYSNFTTWAAKIRQQANAAAPKPKPVKEAVIKQDKPPSKQRDLVVGFIAIGLLVLAGYTINDYLTQVDPVEATLQEMYDAAVRAEAMAKEANQLPQTSDEPATEDVLANDVAVGSHLGRGRQVLSEAALQAISEGFVDIKDPVVASCTDLKIAQFRQAAGEDAIIRYDIHNDIAVDCGFNI